MYGAVVATAFSFYKVNPTAGLIMAPYIAWMTIATAMNYVIWRDNKDKEE
jgi:benzodiazapine receptor